MKFRLALIAIVIGLAMTACCNADKPKQQKEPVFDTIVTRTVLYRPGDYDSRNYRIPAIITAKDGSLVVATDKRKYNDADLPEDIDILINRSTDGGHTWSEPYTLVEGQGVGKGFGDCALVQTHDEGGLFSELKREFPGVEVVLFTAYADIALAVEGMKCGAFDFVVKPWDNAKLLDGVALSFWQLIYELPSQLVAFLQWIIFGYFHLHQLLCVDAYSRLLPTKHIDAAPFDDGQAKPFHILAFKGGMLFP